MVDWPRRVRRRQQGAGTRRAQRRLEKLPIFRIAELAQGEECLTAHGIAGVPRPAPADLPELLTPTIVEGSRHPSQPVDRVCSFRGGSIDREREEAVNVALGRGVRRSIRSGRGGC